MSLVGESEKRKNKIYRVYRCIKCAVCFLTMPQFQRHYAALHDKSNVEVEDEDSRSSPKTPQEERELVTQAEDEDLWSPYDDILDGNDDDNEEDQNEMWTDNILEKDFVESVILSALPPSSINKDSGDDEPEPPTRTHLYRLPAGPASAKARRLEELILRQEQERSLVRQGVPRG